MNDDIVNALITPMMMETFESAYVLPNLLISHCNERAAQLDLPKLPITESGVILWLLECEQKQPEFDGRLVNGCQIYEEGARMLSMSLLDKDLQRLINTDITRLFSSIQDSYQMVNSGLEPIQEPPVFAGTFAELSFMPEGVSEPHRFPNGSEGISSKYLEAVSKELFNQGMLQGKNPRKHKDLLKKIREYSKAIEHGANIRQAYHSYFAIEEGTYYAGKQHPSATHIWMSPDLCLALAGSEHISIQMRIIDDLNRLRNIAQSISPTQLHPNGLASYLPGTLEEHYRNRDMDSLLSGEQAGYYPIAKIKELWASQEDKPESVFDEVYSPEIYYPELNDAMEVLGDILMRTKSTTGELIHLYPIWVLADQFPLINLEELEIV